MSMNVIQQSVYQNLQYIKDSLGKPGVLPANQIAQNLQSNQGMWQGMFEMAQRANLTQDYLMRMINTQHAKLSINTQEPFTSMFSPEVIQLNMLTDMRVLKENLLLMQNFQDLAMMDGDLTSISPTDIQRGFAVYG